MRVSIRSKLLLAMLLSNIIVILTVFVLSNLSFSQSFIDYLDATQEEELSPLVNAIAVEYELQGDWRWLRQRPSPRWRSIVNTFQGIEDELLEEPQFRRPPDGPRRRPPPRQRPPAEGAPEGPPQMFYIADRNKQLMRGREDNQDKLNWIDIKVNGELVGYLGYERTDAITSELDQLFMAQLFDNLKVSSLVVILVSLIIAIYISRLLVKPVLRLREAAHAIAGGDFKARTRTSADDEIGDLSRDFNQLAISLEKNLKSRQQWIADISHELRTPVAVLQGEIEAVLDGVRELNPETLKSLHQETARLTALIKDLHELSLSDAGALSYQFEQLNLFECVDDVLDVQSNLIEKRGVSIDHREPKTSIIIKADAQRLTQLFANLLDNTLAYTHDPASIEIDYRIDGQFVTLSWSDSPPGVSEEQLPRLFERLYRAEGSRNRSSGGSGLGLAIVKNIVEAHQGHIQAEQSSLGGLCFKITFPISHS